jgi:hypothetical protein
MRGACNSAFDRIHTVARLCCSKSIGARLIGRSTRDICPVGHDNHVVCGVRRGRLGAQRPAAEQPHWPASQHARLRRTNSTASFCQYRTMTLAAVGRRLDSYRAASSTAQSSTSAPYCRPAMW